MKRPRFSFGCLERPIARFFFAYGGFVTRNPWPFVVLPILSTLALSTGLMHLSPLSDAVYLFTPTDAPSKIERLAIHEKWPLLDGLYIPGRAVTQTREAQVSVLAREGANILLPEYAEAVWRLDNYIQKRVKVPYRGRNYTYADVCLRTVEGTCAGNDHISVISRLFAHGINITYPRFRIGEQGGYYGSALGAVTLAKGGIDGKENILMSARAWLLIYHLRFQPTNTNWMSGQWEQAFRHALDVYPPDPFLEIAYFHSQTLPDELKRNADSLVPRFVCSFLILVVFSVICSIVTIDGSMYIDWVLSKPLLSIAGVINACMGIASAMGLCVYLGIPYNDIVAVMPFLVVAVGTDNMFLMVAAVRRTSRALSVEDRMGECMADAAVSILITALTDAFSFSVGTITTIPAVQIFCIYTCIAISMTFFYQMTFFCVLVSLFTRHEERGRHCVFMRETVPPRLHSASMVNRLLWMGSRPHPLPEHASNKKDVAGADFFRNWYAPLLVQPAIRILCGVWYTIYVVISIIGCMNLREGLEPVNLLVEDSYAIPHYRILEKYFWQYGAPLQIVVNNAPDLRDPSERARIRAMVHTFASTKHSVGDEGVESWFEEMERFYNLHEVKIENKDFYSFAERFVFSSKSSPWIGDTVWKATGNGTRMVSSFRFIIGMKEIATTSAQQEATRMFREVASRYPSYNVTTFMPLWLFTDQYELVVPNTVQDVVVAVACMLLIAFLLIPEPSCAFWVAFTIGSIDLGVLGFMTLWGVNLDAISMITIIMSVGFSVDYSAHIAYGYVVSTSDDPKTRIQAALGDLGWPVIQGGLSTILAVSVLADVPAYMIVTFFKTVFLAISIGLFHGLLFLPLMLSLFVGTCCKTGVPRPEKAPIELAPAGAKWAPNSASSTMMGAAWSPSGAPAPFPGAVPAFPGAVPVLHAAYSGASLRTTASSTGSLISSSTASSAGSISFPRFPPPTTAPPPLPKRY